MRFEPSNPGFISKTAWLCVHKMMVPIFYYNIYIYVYIYIHIKYMYIYIYTYYIHIYIYGVLKKVGSPETIGFNTNMVYCWIIWGYSHDLGNLPIWTFIWVRHWNWKPLQEAGWCVLVGSSLVHRSETTLIKRNHVGSAEYRFHRQTCSLLGLIVPIFSLECVDSFQRTCSGSMLVGRVSMCVPSLWLPCVPKHIHYDYV